MNLIQKCLQRILRNTSVFNVLVPNGSYESSAINFAGYASGLIGPPLAGDDLYAGFIVHDPNSGINRQLMDSAGDRIYVFLGVGTITRLPPELFGATHFIVDLYEDEALDSPYVVGDNFQLFVSLKS